MAAVDKALGVIAVSMDDAEAVAALRAAGFEAKETGNCACFYGGFCGGDGVIKVLLTVKKTKQWVTLYIDGGWKVYDGA